MASSVPGLCGHSFGEPDAGFGDRDVREQELPGVRQVRRHHVADTDARLPRSGRLRPRLAPPLRPRPRDALVDDRGLVTETVDSRVEDIAEGALVFPVHVVPEAGQVVLG
nr:hypothetical protein [Actinokineospora iranica]